MAQEKVYIAGCEADDHPYHTEGEDGDMLLGAFKTRSEAWYEVRRHRYDSGLDNTSGMWVVELELPCHCITDPCTCDG